MFENRIQFPALLALTMIVFSSCGSDEHTAVSKQPSYPLIGKIILNDNVPQFSVNIFLNPILAEGEDIREASRFKSSEGGNFKGKAPAGKYKVTFIMGHKKDPRQRNDEYVDFLEGAYSDVAESKYHVEIKEMTGDEVNDLGEYKLEAEIVLSDRVKRRMELIEKNKTKSKTP